jgi:hypothetical protein
MAQRGSQSKCGLTQWESREEKDARRGGGRLAKGRRKAIKGTLPIM